MNLSDIPRVSLAHIPTPLQKLERVSKLLNTNIWIKRDDLTGGVLSGNKVRKLEYSFGQALHEGADAIITCGGIQSNHCRATAAAGAQIGLKVCLLLRGQPLATADGNLLLDSLCGAEIDCHSQADFAHLSNIVSNKMKELQARGFKPFFIPTGASDGLGLCGYLNAVNELESDFTHKQINPDYVVCATGSGGTQAGLTLGMHLAKMQTKVLGIAVCDNEAYFQNKVRHDIADWMQRFNQQVNLDSLSVYVNDQYIGAGYAKASSEIFDTIAWLARTEGIVLDPVYTGKAFHGMINEIKQGALKGAKDVVFIHTGGLFGLFPYKNQISIDINNS